MDLWAALADERRTLADDLDAVPAEAWTRPTTCGDWTVRQVVAHLTVPLTVGKLEAVGAIARARNVDKGIAAMTEARADQEPAALLATLRDRAERRFAPPGMGPVAPLSDVVVHGVEIRRAVDVPRRFDDERVRAVLDFLVSGRAIGFAPRRLRGLRFETTDRDWRGGAAGGTLVRGSTEELLLAVTGRPSEVALP